MARPNKEALDQFHEKGLYLPTKTLYVSGVNVAGEEEADNGVDHLLSEQVIKNLTIADTVRPDDPITVILNCEGGDVTHGLAIIDAIRLCKSHVVIKVLGQAQSMGAVILQAGDTRLLSPRSLVMIHQGETAYSGMEKNIEAWMKWEKGPQADYCNDLLLSKIKEKHPDFTLAQLNRMQQFDRILTATQAVDLGLADGVLE